MDLERRGKIGRVTHLRLAAILFLTAASLPVGAQPRQADATAILLGRIRAALEHADVDALRALGAPQLSTASTLVFLRMADLGPSSVALRERQRDTTGRETRTVADLLVSKGQTGRLATWEITSRPNVAGNGRDEIVAIEELGVIDHLRHLLLDRTTGYAVHDFTFAAPDVTVRMARGVAFLADSGAGPTALILRGNGVLTFAPPLGAEQAQVRLFAGRSSLTTKFTDAFIRVPPGTFERALQAGALRAVPASTADAERAAGMFAGHAAQTFTLNLGDLSDDAWSLDPPADSAVVEFKTPRFGWLTYTRTPGEVEDVALFDRTHRRQISLYSSSDAQARTAGTRDSGYDILHDDVDVRVDPGRASITARAALTVRFTRPPGGSITLRLAESLAVSSVSSPQLGRLFPMRVVGQDQLLVSLPAAIRANDEVRLDITYAGHLESQALDREAVTVAASPQDSEVPVVPTTPRFVLSTRRAWYPQAASADYATATLRVTTPADLSVVATGRRDDGPATSALTPAVSGTWQTTAFDAEKPVRYLACVISRWRPAGTAIAIGARDRVTVSAVAAGPQSRASTDLAGDAARILTFYARQLADEPYPTFTVASIDDELPGGHSPAYFALIQQPRLSSLQSWQNDPVAFEGVPDFVLAHEIAHQWWGQAVGFSSYHDQWLSEGLAQYFALRYIAATRSPSVTRGVFVRMRRSVSGLEAEGPISLGYRLGHIRATPRVFRAVVYNKSALVLDMVRRLIGDDAFTNGLRSFYAASRFRAATTNALRDALEQASGRSLARVFDRWIRSAELPRLRVAWQQTTPGELAVTVTQTGEVFDIPVPIVIEYRDGSRGTRDVTSGDTVTVARIAVRGPVRQVRVDRDTTLARW